MSIMDFFKSAGGATVNQIQQPVPQGANPTGGAAQTPAQAAAAVGNPAPTPGVTAQSPGTAPNGTVPVGAAETPKAPLEQFANLWDAPTPVMGADGKPVPTGRQPILSIDPKKIMEAAKQTDFSKLVPVDLQARISKGGQDGLAASIEAMNIVGQASLGQAATMSATMTERALATAEERFVSRIPELLKGYTAKESLRAENPAFNNPAVAPMITGVQNQLALKFPNASPSELNALTKQYITDIVSTFTPAPVVDPKVAAKAAKQDTDWESLFLGN